MGIYSLEDRGSQSLALWLFVGGTGLSDFRFTLFADNLHAIFPPAELDHLSRLAGRTIQRLWPSGRQATHDEDGRTSDTGCSPRPIGRILSSMRPRGRLTPLMIRRSSTAEPRATAENSPAFRREEKAHGSRWGTNILLIQPSPECRRA
jgi:hypothetical protein